jgi:hypothetical protein
MRIGVSGVEFPFPGLPFQVTSSSVSVPRYSIPGFPDDALDIGHTRSGSGRSEVAFSVAILTLDRGHSGQFRQGLFHATHAGRQSCRLGVGGMGRGRGAHFVARLFTAASGLHVGLVQVDLNGARSVPVHAAD